MPDADRCFRCVTSLVGARPRFRVAPASGEPLQPACARCAADVLAERGDPLMPAPAALQYAEQVGAAYDFERVTAGFDHPDDAA